MTPLTDEELLALIQDLESDPLGFVQRFGFGIAEARRAMAANGNSPPAFQVEPTNVLATLQRTPPGTTS